MTEIEVKYSSRSAKLADLRNLKMARSPHGYVRGNTAKFYEWLNTGPSSRVPQGPEIWICGDCHLSNLGPLADARGRVDVQIRDLDQTVIGNPAHDLIRLGLSFASAVRGSDLPGVTTAKIIEQLIAGYESALGGEEADAPDDEPKIVRAMISHAVRRRWHHLAMEKLGGKKPSLPRGNNFWPLSKQERADIAALFDELSLASIFGSAGCKNRLRVKILDSAYWVKGCSSLGRLRYAATLKVDEGDKTSFRLVDIKEAVKAAAPSSPGAVMPTDNAERVLAGARALSPNLGDRMIASTLSGVSVFLRELAPQDLKLEVDRLTRDESTALARYLGSVVGQAHSRQMDPPVRKAWVRELAKARKRGLDAPSWLWSSVVDLLSAHELAYLEHCRQFALPKAA